MGDLKKLNLKDINPDVIFLTNGNIQDARKFGYKINKPDKKTLETFNLRCIPTLYIPIGIRYKIKEIKVSNR